MYVRALQGKEKALGLDHTSTLNTVNNLGNLYADQGKLAEAEKMYGRALRGYKEALGNELVASYLPALNSMIGIGDLFSKTDRNSMAEEMYTRALSGYKVAQGPSSKRCSEIEGRLKALQFMPADVKSQHTSTQAEKFKIKARLQRFFSRPRQ